MSDPLRSAAPRRFATIRTHRPVAATLADAESLSGAVKRRGIAGTKAYQVSTLSWAIHRWQFPPCPPRTTGFFPVPCPSLGAAYPRVNFVSRQSQGNRGVVGEPTCACAGASCLDYVIQSVTCVGGKLTCFDTAHGNALKPALAAGRPGDPMIEAAPGDTTFASDSISVNVLRTVGNVTLNGFEGQLKHDSGTSGDKGSVRSTLFIACYQDSNLAKADVGNTGSGSVFFGKVVFTQSKVLTVSGGFSPTDFVLMPNPDGSGSNVVRPSAGLTRSIAVANSNDATVVMAIDAAVDASANVPGVSPVGIALLTLLLLGSGVGFVAVPAPSIEPDRPTWVCRSARSVSSDRSWKPSRGGFSEGPREADSRCRARFLRLSSQACRVAAPPLPETDSPRS